MRIKFPFSYLNLIIISSLFYVGCTSIDYTENRQFEDFFHQLSAEDYSGKAILIIPMNNSCSSCRKMTIDKISDFLTFENVRIVLSDIGEKNIKLAIPEGLIQSDKVIIDNKFLSKRYDLVSDYPVMVFSNKEGNIHIKSISAATFEGDMGYIKDMLL